MGGKQRYYSANEFVTWKTKGIILGCFSGSQQECNEITAPKIFHARTRISLLGALHQEN